MQKGFTMAEVLITIGIIGLVAAMTLPTLINNAKNKELEAAFKKQYSLLTQAINHLQSQDVCTHTSCLPAGTTMYDYFSKIYKINKRCDNMPEGLPEYDMWCFPKNQNDSIYTNYTKTSSYLPSAYFDNGQFYTMDGALITFEKRATDSKVIISVDVNGRAKRPNALGHDLFMFQIIDKGPVGVLVPMGAEGTLYENEETYCSKTSSNGLNGAACTIKALYDPKYFTTLP